MATLTITLPTKDLEKAKEQAKYEGFESPVAWLRFLVANRLSLEESPKIKPSGIVSAMKKTGFYKSSFLHGLKKSLEYADKAIK